MLLNRIGAIEWRLFRENRKERQSKIGRKIEGQRERARENEKM